MAYEPLTVKDVAKDIEKLKSDANAGRIYNSADRKNLQQAYDGGKELTNPSNGWILPYSGETEEQWETRQNKLRGGVNPCRLIPDKITAAMTNGTVIIECEDKDLQEQVDNARRHIHWDDIKRREVERLASIYGLCNVGVYWNEQKRMVDYWWTDIDTLYPVQSGKDASTLDAFFISRGATQFTGQYQTYSEALDIWTPTERAQMVKGGKSSIDRFLKTITGQTVGNGKYVILNKDVTNPWGCIPFVPFRARPSARVNSWWALADIHEARETLKFLLEMINSLDQTMDKQIHAQLVIEGGVDIDELTLGPNNPLVIEARDGNGSAYYIVADVAWESILAIIDAFYKYAFEVEGVPIILVRTTEAPESGVAIHLKLKPIQEIAEERRKRHAEAERTLWIYTAMALQIYGDAYKEGGAYGKVWGWQEAQDYIQELSEMVKVVYADDYSPTDEADETATIQALYEAEMIDRYERFQRLHPGASVAEWEEWEQTRIDREKQVREMERDLGLETTAPFGQAAELPLEIEHEEDPDLASQALAGGDDGR